MSEESTALVLTEGDLRERSQKLEDLQEPMQQPPFAELRATITDYGDALRKGLTLPPASGVFGKKQYNEIYAQGKAEARILVAHEEAKQLQAASTECEDDEDLKPWT